MYCRRSVFARRTTYFPLHTQRCLHALIITGNVIKRVIAHSLIEEPGAIVAGAYLQCDAGDAGNNRTLFEPLKKLSSATQAPVWRNHSKEVQVRPIIAVTHDSKAGNMRAATCDDYVDIGGADTRGHPGRCPPPFETVFNQVARQVGDRAGLWRPRQAQQQAGGFYGVHRIYLLSPKPANNQPCGELPLQKRRIYRRLRNYLTIKTSHQRNLYSRGRRRFHGQFIV